MYSIVAEPMKGEFDEEEDNTQLDTAALHFAELMVITIEEQDCNHEQKQAILKAVCHTHPFMNYVWFLLERSAFSDAQFSRAAQMMNAIREASTRMHEGVTLRQVLI